MSGVGGMGIGVVGAILVRAAHKEGYHVAFQDKKGPGHPQRRRLRPAHLCKSRRDRRLVRAAVTGSIPYGKADLLLGIDVLEAARAIDPREQFRVASPEQTAAVLNLHKQPTVFNLLGKRRFRSRSPA